MAKQADFTACMVPQKVSRADVDDADADVAMVRHLGSLMSGRFLKLWQLWPTG